MALSQRITLREVAANHKQPTVTGFIYGLALGSLSTSIHVPSLGITILVAHSLWGMFGVVSVASGMLGSLTVGFGEALL